MLAGMPEPAPLRRHVQDGEWLLTGGGRLLFRFDADDRGMRNLAVVALTDAGYRVNTVAQVFGLTATYVSMLRGRARRAGSSALVPAMGRPVKLSAGQVGQARRWAGEGVTNEEIARRLGVHNSTVSRLINRRGRLAPSAIQPDLDTVDPDTGAEPTGEPEPADVGDAETFVDEGRAAPPPVEAAADGDGPAGTPVGAAPAAAARIGVGQWASRYAGATLLYPFLHRAGAAAMFASVSGGPARRYDDVAVLTSATLCFALGVGSVEGVKHLSRGQVGPVVGLAVLPELRTLRARLAALADGSDPLAVQRAAAAGLLSADPADDTSVYFVDDHFVPYAGAKPLAKGWNSKRRQAQRGRADTVVTDIRGRAVCFTSGEPAGLTRTLPGALAELRRVVGADAPILLGFDRGGSYPVTFSHCRDAGVDWVSYRRGPLAATGAAPAPVAVVHAGTTRTLSLADETVELAGYGPARQLTVYEHGTPALQILTSLTTTSPAELVVLLRARWRIENTYKYLAQHYGIDWLCDYRADITPNTAPVDNPARIRGRAARRAAEADLAAAERALAQLLASPAPVSEINKAIPAAQQKIATASARVEDATGRLAAVPAKLPANQVDPTAKRARPRLPRRGLQMVLRLLAHNAETWLATRLDAYLNDPDEHRALTRHLLHLGGSIHYTRRAVTVTLDRPDSPRLARALHLLLDELNTTPARLPGDQRPLTYRLTDRESQQ
jgi:transposase